MPSTWVPKWQWPAGFAGVAFLLASCTTSEAALADVGASQFGWVEGQCLGLKEPLDTLPHNVWIAPAKDGTPMTEAIAVTPIDPSAPEAAKLCNALHPDRAAINGGGEHWFYRLDRALPPEVALATLTPPQGGRAYGVCFTTEGVRLTVRQDKQVIWEDYYYLGYDVEPSCS